MNTPIQKRNVARTGWGLKPIFANIPTDLHSLRWGCWVAEQKTEGKVAKAPRHPDGGWLLSTNKPERWPTFDECRAGYLSGLFDGVGLLLEADIGIVGIDIDDATNTLKRHPEVLAQLRLISATGGYIERSPSGNGLRIFVLGNLPLNAGKKSDGLEIYSDRRFLTVTGHGKGMEHE